MNSLTWTIVEPDAAAICDRLPNPLEALAAADVPALVIRQAFPRAASERLMTRLIDEELLYDPAQPVPEKFVEASIPEGYFREGRSGQDRFAWERKTAGGRRRIDIGTSLGYRGSDADAFFDHAADTHALFARLFADTENPVTVCYDRLASLAPR